MAALCASPATAAAPPGRTNSDLPWWAMPPFKRIVAEIAFGRDTFANTHPEATTASLLAVGCGASGQWPARSDTHVAFNRFPAPAEAMYGTTTESLARTTRDLLSVESRSPSLASNGIVVPSLNFALTMTWAASPSKVRGPWSTDTVAASCSNGCTDFLPPKDRKRTENPRTIDASSSWTSTGLVSIFRAADPISLPSPPFMRTKALPGARPLTMLSETICATAWPPASFETEIRPRIVEEMSAVKSVVGWSVRKVADAVTRVCW